MQGGELKSEQKSAIVFKGGNDIKDASLKLSGEDQLLFPRPPVRPTAFPTAFTSKANSWQRSRERSHELGATIHFITSPGHGTEVVLSYPFSKP